MRFLRIDRFGTPLGDVEGVLEARRKRDVGGTDTLELTMTGPLEKDDRVVARDSKGRWCEWICTSPQGERMERGTAQRQALAAFAVRRGFGARTRRFSR